ncbi:uncharacterized protein LOC135145859 [Zophobas morio]|uniref:uncharacterized protein LOC135145859 n=1 Tax=Zophobas morio TaxID=2755281 RepID=UPI0030839DE1
MSADVILDVISVVLQSNAEFFTSDYLSIQVDRVRPPAGYGTSAINGKAVSFNEYSVTKNSIYVIDNQGTDCLGMALVVAKMYCDSNNDRKSLKQFSQARGKILLQTLAAELCRASNVCLINGGNYVQLNDFQEYLSDYTIVVYSSRVGNSVYFEGPRAPGKKCLNLIMENNHYNVILSLTGAFSTQYFCELCRVRYSRGDRHKSCPYICPCCHASPPCNINDNGENILKCRSCLRCFRGRICLEKHIAAKLCEKLKKCHICHKHIWVNKKTNHICGVSRCSTCRADKPVRHFCYMQPNRASLGKAEENVHDFLFVFYDLETTQDKQIREGMFLHEPNLCVIQKACRICILIDDVNGNCYNCGQRQLIYKEDPVDRLLEHVAEMSKKFKVTAIAHNMKGFDGSFLLQKMFDNVSRWCPEVIRTGTKLMSITCGTSIRFIDSLNFIQLPLSRFPSAFKIQGCKGYFPHYFNKSTNKNYVGTIPEKCHYGCDSMMPDERARFVNWHNEQIESNAVFDMGKEIVKYCIQDVDLLRKGCLKFRDCFISGYGIDPFLESLTIASACNLVFRRNFLQKDTIGIIPRNGYRCGDNQSEVAIKWLTWIGHSNNIVINHAANGRETRLPENILVDGFCEATNTVFEFYGCWYHGCEKCYFDQTCKLSDKKDGLFIKREATLDKEYRIKAAGYNLLTIWQCQYEKELKRNPAMQEFINAIPRTRCPPLNPRDAFYGGRTNACKLYYNCTSDDEKIMYYDVCSLYPYINKYGKYPIGHPIKIYVGDNECRQVELQSVEGLIKCLVLPPQNLYHPVLPYRCNNKLTFPLCRTCVEGLLQTECTHAESERQFVGTFVADELRKAVELRYRVIEIFEIWEYKTVIYDKETNTPGLFSSYINCGLKGKQENSGFPAWCDTNEKKDMYIASYFEKEGILLEKNKITQNSGMRFLYKIMLNSFWGKFGQKENAPKTEIINKSIDLFKLLTNPSAEVHNLTIINSEVVLATWNKVDEDIDPLKTVNVVVAAYTTAGARLELYKYLERLDRRVLYFDTDSVIFSQKNGEWMPPVGDFLGDLTDELGEYGDGSFISEFVSGGPKNYCYKFWSCKDQSYKTVCKVKGITLNYETCKILNFNKMKDMICNREDDEDDEILRLNSRVIVRNPRYDVFTKHTMRARVCVSLRPPARAAAPPPAPPLRSRRPSARAAPPPAPRSRSSVQLR